MHKENFCHANSTDNHGKSRKAFVIQIMEIPQTLLCSVSAHLCAPEKAVVR